MSAVASSYRERSFEEKITNDLRTVGWPWLIDATGERSLSHLVLNNRWATVVQIADNFNTRDVLRHIVHRILLNTGMLSRTLPSTVIPPIHRRRLQWDRKRRSGPWTIERRSPLV